MKTLAMALLAAVVGFSANTAARAQTATLEQAKDLVKKARTALRDQGCDKTFKEVTEGTAFKVKEHSELYIFMYNEKLVNLAHGGNPKLVGKDLREMRDTKGRFFNQELLAAAKKGGGSVEFDFLNPATGNVDPKVGWAELEPKTGCGAVMVGSGVYRPKGK